MDIELKKRFLKSMQELKSLQDPEENPNLDFGICGALLFLHTLDSDDDQLVDEFFQWKRWAKSTWSQWPKYSGYREFPVPSDTARLTPERKFYGSCDKWSGQYGQLRMELLDFLIAKMEEEIANETV